MIVAVAIKTSDGIIHFLPKPNRHNDVIHALHIATETQYKMNKLILAHGEQGFITSEGNFVDRKVAGQIAIKCGQIEKLEFPPNLYSEDLW